MTDSSDAAYGRSGSDWDQAVQAARTFLVEQSRLGRTTSYTELNAVLGNRTRFGTFDFDLEPERAALGHLLGLVVQADRPTSGVMLSAIVVYLNGNDPGPGFYVLATELGLIGPDATDAEKLEFWTGELGRVHEHYGRPRRS